VVPDRKAFLLGAVEQKAPLWQVSYMGNVKDRIDIIRGDLGTFP